MEFEGKVGIGSGRGGGRGPRRERGGGSAVPFEEPCLEDGNGVVWVAGWGARGGPRDFIAEGQGHLKRPHPPSLRGGFSTRLEGPRLLT